LNSNQNTFGNNLSTNVFGNSVNNSNPFGNSNVMNGGSFGNFNNNLSGNGQNTSNAFQNSNNSFANPVGGNNTFLQKPANPITIPQNNVSAHLFQPRK
jgi:hypothetical protein